MLMQYKMYVVSVPETNIHILAFANSMIEEP